MRRKWVIAMGLALVTLFAGSALASAQETPAGSQTAMFERTPPRLAYLSGEVSFWRPGAPDWAPARVNTPLAPGDVLYTGAAGNLEIQIGARAFVRASAGTRVGLDNQEPDFLQFRVTAGHVSLDLRDLPAGHTVEVDTPNAAFTIERTGYYRVDVAQDMTTFVTRRGGRATMTPAAGPTVAITPSEQVVITGMDSPRVETYVAPALTEWDRWNYVRTDQLIEAMSARYVPPGVHGVDDLDHYGTWRIVADHGAVWVPDATPAGWAPYSTGHWIWDPYYGWTWVDDAPWGWAPYHYGRWVYVAGFWAWAPGPLVVRPHYAPAFVAFFGWGIVGRPIGWVALSWGEPLIPWWGPVGFVGVPWWGGWGGPRIVNNVVISHTTVVHVTNITVYRNATVPRAVIAVPAERFGRGHTVASARLTQVDVLGLTPIHGPLGVKPAPASLVPGTGRAVRPPEAVQQRRVVATRAPHDVSRVLRAEGLSTTPASAPSPPPRLVAKPSQPEVTAPPTRPPFGGQNAPERPRPPRPPRFEPRLEGKPGSEGAPPPPRRPQPEAIVPAEPRRLPSAPRPEPPGAERRSAPGEATRPAPPSAHPRPEGAGRAPVVQPPEAQDQGRRRPVEVTPAPRAVRPSAPTESAPGVRAEGSEGRVRKLPGELANRLFPGQPERKPPQVQRPEPAGREDSPAAGPGRPRGRD